MGAITLRYNSITAANGGDGRNGANGSVSLHYIFCVGA